MEILAELYKSGIPPDVLLHGILLEKKINGRDVFPPWTYSPPFPISFSTLQKSFVVVLCFTQPVVWVH